MVLKREDYIELAQTVCICSNIQDEDLRLTINRGCTTQREMVIKNIGTEVELYDVTNGSRNLVLSFDVGFVMPTPALDIVTLFLAHYCP